MDAKKKGRKSIAAEMIEDLSALRDTVKKGIPVEEKFTVRKVKLNLRPQDYDGNSVRITRTRLGVSQSLFAQMLGVSVDLVQSWEQNVRRPQPIACRLLDQMNLDPTYWQNWLRRAMEESPAGSGAA